MEKILYNVKVWEKKKKMAQFQTISAVIAFIGLLSGTIGNYVFSDKPTHLPIFTMSLLGLGIIAFFFLSLSSWTNYSFLYYYFYCQWIGQQSTEELELITGRIMNRSRVVMPYVGTFYSINVRLHNGEEVSLYMKPKLYNRIEHTESIRLLVFHMFVYDLK